MGQNGASSWTSIHPMQNGHDTRHAYSETYAYTITSQAVVVVGGGDYVLT